MFGIASTLHRDVGDCALEFAEIVGCRRDVDALMFSSILRNLVVPGVGTIHGRRLELEPKARAQCYDYSDPNADRKGPGTDGKSRETERPLSWRGECRGRAPGWCSFRSSLGYCHVHSNFSSLDFQDSFSAALKADQPARTVLRGARGTLRGCHLHVVRPARRRRSRRRS
jgi:hypothetical protein